MLADQIIYLRRKAGMSQPQLAKKLNIGPSAIGMYEQGRRTPGIEMLIDMANLFEVSLDYLITGREAANTAASLKEEATQFACPCRACCCCRKQYESARAYERHANAGVTFGEMPADPCQSLDGSATRPNDTTETEKRSTRRP